MTKTTDDSTREAIARNPEIRKRDAKIAQLEARLKQMEDPIQMGNQRLQRFSAAQSGAAVPAEAAAKFTQDNPNPEPKRHMTRGQVRLANHNQAVTAHAAEMRAADRAFIEDSNARLAAAHQAFHDRHRV